MADNSGKKPDTSIISAVCTNEYCEKLAEVEKALRRMLEADRAGRDDLNRRLDEAVQGLIRDLRNLVKEETREADRILDDYLKKIQSILDTMDEFLADSRKRMQEAKRRAWQEYNEVHQWWQGERDTFTRHLIKVFDAAAGVAGIGKDDYRRVLLLPTWYKLEVAPIQDTSYITKFANIAVDSLEIGAKLVGPAFGIPVLSYKPDVDTRILFYKNPPPCMNPWVDTDNKPEHDREQPIEFPIKIPLSSVVPITFARGLPTRVFAPFQDRHEEDRNMLAGVQFLFSDKLRSDTNWIWLFLDELDAKDKEINRYGFGWYLQGRFYQDRSLSFSIENRMFVDAVHIDFTAKDSKGRGFNSIHKLEPNYTNNVYVELVTNNNTYHLTTELRGNQKGIVGRRVELSATVKAKAQEIVGGEIGITVKAALPDTLITTIGKVGDEMIRSEVIESLERMKERTEKSTQNFLDAFHARCPKPDCDGVGSPIGYIPDPRMRDRYLREYHCVKCRGRFNSDESDKWDQAVSALYGIGNHLAALAHTAHAIAKTAWAIMKVVGPQVVQKDADIVVQVWGKGKIGLQSGGVGGGPGADLKIKIFEIKAPIAQFDSVDDWLTIAELCARIYLHIGRMIYEDIKSASPLTVLNIITGLTTLSQHLSGRLVKYYLTAIPLALQDLHNQAWVEKAYKDVRLAIGGDLSFSVSGEAGAQFKATVKPVDIGLECNLGALCRDSQKRGIPNVYKLACGNSFEVKAGGSIPNPYIVTAGFDVGIGFPLKTVKVGLKTQQSLFHE